MVKQLLEDTYDIAYPGVVGVYLTGKPNPAVGPHDIAIALVGAVFKNGYVKNKVMEFVGPGVASMSTDYRNSVDVMRRKRRACLPYGGPTKIRKPISPSTAAAMPIKN